MTHLETTDGKNTSETIQETIPAAVPAETPEDRNKRYRERKKANERRKREQRREEVDSGRVGERRLAFLVDIYTSLGYTQQSFAEACGISAQLLNWYISVTDDCPLSRLETMMGKVGLSISVRLDPAQVGKIQRTFSRNGSKYRIEGSFEGVTAKSLLPEYITTCGPERRLHFLRTFIEDSNMTVPVFCKRCEMDMTVLRYYFNRDDMKLSILYGIAEHTGAELVWTVNPLKAAPKPQEKQ